MKERIKQLEQTRQIYTDKIKSVGCPERFIEIIENLNQEINNLKKNQEIMENGNNR